MAATCLTATNLTGAELTSRATWDTNVSNSDRKADVVGSLGFQLSGSAARRYSLTADDGLFAGGHVALETWPRFMDLARLTIGVDGAVRHKFGLGAQAPVASLELAAHGVAARDSDRSGIGGTAAVRVEKRFGARTRLGLALTLDGLEARKPLFDRQSRELTLEAVRDLGMNWQVGLDLGVRRGLVLSYATPPRPRLATVARNIAPTQLFGSPRVAYSLKVPSLSAGLRLMRPVGESTSLTIGAGYRRSGKNPFVYVNRLVSVALTRQF